MAQSKNTGGATPHLHLRVRGRRLAAGLAYTVGMVYLCSVLVHRAVVWAAEPGELLSVGSRIAVTASITLLGVGIGMMRLLWPRLYGWSVLALSIALAYESTGQ